MVEVACALSAASSPALELSTPIALRKTESAAASAASLVALSGLYFAW